MVDPSPALLLTVVVIGHNEGNRLSECLESLRCIHLPAGQWELIYVDSNSTDNSIATAMRYTSHIVAMPQPPHSAAAARNAGWKKAQGEYVLFLDGDTRLQPGFVEEALPYFADEGIAAISGWREERDPQQSWYNAVLDIEWRFKPGPLLYCGGDALFRRAALVESGGYRDTLRQGEEPELCRRLRGSGWSILGLDRPMTLHDLHITSFKQYWNRCFRTGYAYAEVSDLYKNTDDPLWLRESRHNLWKGGAFFVLAAVAIGWGVIWKSFAMPLAFLTLVLFLILRTAYRKPMQTKKLTWLYGLHSHVQHLPMFFGQLAYGWDRWSGRTARSINYKSF